MGATAQTELHVSRYMPLVIMPTYHFLTSDRKSMNELRAWSMMVVVLVPKADERLADSTAASANNDDGARSFSRRQR